MKYILFLYLTGFGWIEFSTEDSKQFCEKVRGYITENHPEYTDSACILKMPV